MTISVHFEWPAGNDLQTTRFEPGQNLHIAVSVDGWPAALSMLIYPERTGDFTPIAESGAVNPLGHKAFDIVLPNVVAKAKAYFEVEWELYPGTIFNESKTINIGIGTDPTPKSTFDWKQAVLWSGVAIGVGLFGYGIFQIVSSRKPQRVIVSTPSPTPTKLLTK